MLFCYGRIRIEGMDDKQIGLYPWLLNACPQLSQNLLVGRDDFIRRDKKPLGTRAGHPSSLEAKDVVKSAL